MKVIRARVLGFCMGVRRAVDLACREAALQQADAAGKVYTLGPLIHNPRVLERLKLLGVQIMDESRLPKDLTGVSVIIRAHGVSPQTEALIRGRGGRVVDATCPRVKGSQLKAAALAVAGYRIFLAGEKHHAEIAGITGYAGTGFYAVTGSAAEAEEAAARLMDEDAAAKTALIGQTTITVEEYNSIGESLKKFFPDLEIAQTICPVTEERQEALRELADTVDAVIIAGGKESANTRRLFAIAGAAGKPCALVETVADIPPEFFRFETVGLAAGTSTPDSVIAEIERALESGSC